MFHIFLIFLSLSLSASIENCTMGHISELTIKSFPTQENMNFSELFTIIELDESTNAKCLDGSNYKFLYSPGFGSGKDKFMIYWQAASFCGAEGIDILESCYLRFSTNFGSSNNIGDNGTIYDFEIPMGYFSSSEEYNQLFYNYNKILLLYCDGSVHQGYLEEPILVNDVELYFRGFQNTNETLNYAKANLGLFNATEIIFSGTSSGGFAAIFWASHLQKGYFPDNIRLLSIIDASMMLDTYNNYYGCHLFRYYLQKLSNLTNSSNCSLFQNCQYNNPDEISKCLMPQYSFENLNIPTFIMNDQYDYSQLTSLNTIECIANGGPYSCNTTEREMITDLREIFLTYLFSKMIPEKPHWGFWIRSCFEHTLAGTWAWYGNNVTAFNAQNHISLNLKDSLSYWYNDGKTLKDDAYFIDFIDWLHNPECETRLS